MKAFVFFNMWLILAWLQSVAAETIVVNINDYAYLPGAQTITVGDSVQWVNLHNDTHDVTETNSLWASTALIKNQTYKQVFNKPGTYRYFCSFHPGMRGSITVTRSAERARIQIGKNLIAAKPSLLPITLNLSGKNASDVYLGSYIVNAQGGCVDCHSCVSYAAGHNPYQGQAKQFNAEGYLAGGKAFGSVVSANLTPDSKGLPAGLSLTKFKALMRTGISSNQPSKRLMVMPWPIYGLMSDRDLDAIYAYLTAIPQAAQPLSGCE